MLLPDTPDQQLTLLISGTDSYLASDLQITINGGIGPAPFITHVFGDTGGTIPSAGLVGSVWAGGLAGIGGSPNGTAFDSSGLETIAAFQTSGATPTNAAGVYARLTVSTVGVPGGTFTLSFAGTTLISGLDPETEEAILVPLSAPDIFLGGLLLGNPELAATPGPGSVISLGNALAPSAPAEIANAVQLANVGTSGFVIDSATITGPDAGLFEIVGFAPDSVAAGTSSDFSLRFLGAATPGTYSAQLSFLFDGLEDNGPISYPLTATVVPEPSTLLLGIFGVFVLLACGRIR